MKRCTTEEFIERARQVHGDKYDYSKVEYANNRTKVCIICPIHGEFWQRPNSHLRGCGCMKCGDDNKKSSTDEFIEKARKIHGYKYDYSKVEYINGHTKVCIICPIHGEFWQTPNNHLIGGGCPKCNSGVRFSVDEFIERAKKIHGDKYDYSKVEYVNSYTKVCIICPIHGEFWQKPCVHLRGQGCPKCYRYKQKFSTEEFIERARQVHGDKYDYSKVNYINANTKICIICPKHGEFWQAPHSHLKGQGCPKCSDKQKLSTEEFIERARQVHGDKYDYSKVEYVNNRTKVCIICPIHGEFWQIPYSHLQGIGCPKCGDKKSSTEEFIEHARQVHGDKYDYSKVNYINARTKVCIICPKHGEFWQTPNSHLMGNNCPKCKSSKLEESVRKFLDENKMKYRFQYRNKNVLGRQTFDFYLPIYNVAIECQGLQHFEPICFSKRIDKNILFKNIKERDNLKIRKCKENGIRLIHYNPFKKYYGTYENEVHNIKELEKMLITS